ncbi:MAG: hypothetical protein EZS28_029748 [Streblomastix strix]|uniref:Uncharacterized protein n=1 Tax=Streblomastix strix TaxID=222440 RepID=A0A5J4UYA2_9EUKA|nr:MAG: hypothetical protein EZS28_029748 [Streblomastix strix]
MNGLWQISKQFIKLPRAGVHPVQMDKSMYISMSEHQFKNYLKTVLVHMDNSHHFSTIQIYGIMVNGRSQIDSACDSGHSGHLGHMNISSHLSTPLIN